jgi:hypothetical protein
LTFSEKSLYYDIEKYNDRGVEQLVARWAHNPKVGGSNPPPATIGLKMDQWFVDPFFLGRPGNDGVMGEV